MAMIPDHTLEHFLPNKGNYMGFREVPCILLFSTAKYVSIPDFAQSDSCLIVSNNKIHGTSLKPI